MSATSVVFSLMLVSLFGGGRLDMPQSPDTDPSGNISSTGSASSIMSTYSALSTVAPMVSTDNAPITVSTDNAPSTMSTDNVASIVSTDSTSSTVPTDNAPSITSTNNVSSMVPSTLSVVPTDSAPSTVPTDSVPSTVPTDNAPSTVPTDSVPSTTSTDSVPSTVPTGNALSTVPTDSVLSTTSTDSVPNTVPTDSTPSTISTDSVPSTVLTNNASSIVPTNNVMPSTEVTNPSTITMLSNSTASTSMDISSTDAPRSTGYTSVTTTALTGSGMTTDGGIVPVGSGSGMPTEDGMNNVVVGWERNEYLVSETMPLLLACVSVMSGQVLSNITVRVYATEGTGTEQEGYHFSNGSVLIFTSSILSICVNVSIFDDAELQGNKSFHLLLQTDNNNVILLPARSTIIIVDNEIKLLSPILLNPELFGKPYYGNAGLFVSCVSHLAYSEEVFPPNIGYYASVELSYVSTNNNITSEIIEIEPTPIIFGVMISNISLPLVVSEINVTCISYLAPLEPGSRFIASDQVRSKLRVTPVDPPVIFNLSPRDVRVIDVVPYNNYTLTCNATLSSNLLLTVYYLWFEGMENMTLTSPSDTVTIHNIPPSVIGDEIIYSSVLSIIEPNARSVRRTCQGRVQLLQNNRTVSNVTSYSNILIQGYRPPASPTIFNVSALSTTWALITFNVTFIAYTPEQYQVAYSILHNSYLYSDILNGSRNITSVNFYAITLSNLEPNTQYNYTIISTNNYLDTVAFSISSTFFTLNRDIFSIRENDITVPTGTLVNVSLFRSEELELENTVYWYSLTNTTVPAHVSFIITENNIPVISLFIADVSLSGEYILCRRNDEMDICGGLIYINITVPVLSVSTTLLILQYNGNRIASDADRSLYCTPSDSRAPIRWRERNTIFPILGRDLQENLVNMGQILIFPETFYGISPPDRTIELICDLHGSSINVAELSPRTIIVRFIQKPVSILYEDHEIRTRDAVINFFPVVGDTNQLSFSLVCVSIYSNLVWESSVPNSSNFTNSNNNITAQQKIISLSMSPFTMNYNGRYICKSEVNVNASVYATTINPLFELVSTELEYFPIGAEINDSLTVRYGDSSVGYMQLDRGFTYSLTFSSFLDTIEEEIIHRNILIDSTATRSNETFIRHQTVANNTGMFLWRAFAIGRELQFVASKHLIVTIPIFVEYDPSVYSLLGMNVTLRCLPNDTRAPVIWSKSRTVIQSSDTSYTFSPPGSNHFITFNTSVVFSPNAFRQTVSFNCNFRTTNPNSALPVFLRLLSGRIEIQNSGSFIENNTIINVFNLPSRDRRETSDSDYIHESPLTDNRVLGQLALDCSGVQGDHMVSWYTDSSLLDSGNGSVSCDLNRFNRQIVSSNYTARLEIRNIISAINGNYTCISSLSYTSFHVEITTANPYLRRLSPAVISAINGEAVELGFRVAVNSNGRYSENHRILFVFNDTAGATNRAPPFMRESTHNYYLRISSVQESDSGVYIAMADACGDYEEEFEDCDLEVSSGIRLIVSSYCSQEVANGFLWPRILEENIVKLPCNLGGSSFRTETMATRHCLIGGIWSEPDLSTCTLKKNVDLLLLVWFVLEADQLPDDNKTRLLELMITQDLASFNVSVSNVRLYSTVIASISLSFEVTLSRSLPEQSEALSAYRNYFNNQFSNFSGMEVRETNRGLLQVASAASCPCSGSSGSASTNDSVIELCAGAPSSPCQCSDSVCQCISPFVGDGRFCTLDSDEDSYPDQPLQSPSCSTSGDSYCIQDNCRLVTNRDQNPMACVSAESIRSINPVFDGCLFERDSAWQVLWPNTPRGSKTTQQCPGGLESLGKATRLCNSMGEWEEPNVLSCESVRISLIQAQANEAFSSNDPDIVVEQVGLITEELVRATGLPVTRLASGTVSLLPLDLQTTVNLLSGIVSILDTYDVTSDTTENVINIFNNILDVNHTIGWNILGKSPSLNGSELLLYNAERYSLVLVNSKPPDGNPVRLSRSNIVISVNTLTASSEVTEIDLQFPVSHDLVNFSVNYIPVVSRVPPEFVNSLLDAQNENNSIPVSHILFLNLENFLRQNNSSNTSSASLLYSVQVKDSKSRNLSSPLKLKFTFNKKTNISAYNCTFWEFSNPVGNGGFVSDGVTTQSNISMNSLTTVTCLSNHLTTFAVLVDVAGVTLPPQERLALQIVSYIGCVVSIVCLFFSVIFFISLRKKLMDSINYFVHLNLSVSLLMAYTVFVFGIELGNSTKGGCLFVALLLHYLFLSSFCWMLSEGIVLYFLLVDVFNRKGNKWWIYILIGYVSPIPVVVISVASRFNYYGVRDENGELLYCWLAVEKGTIFAFVAPMMAIIIVNVVFLGLGLHSLYKRRRGGHNKKKNNKTTERVKSLLVASMVLVPLLGLTWAFGILTINANSTVFAWLFTIFNSFQGLAIFFFHVVRNERIWNKLTNPCRRSGKNIAHGKGAKWYSYSQNTTYKTRESTSGYTLSSVGSGSTMKKSDISSSNIEDGIKIDLSIMDSTVDPVKVDISLNDSVAIPDTADVVENTAASVNTEQESATSQPETTTASATSDPSDNISSDNAVIVTNEQVVGSDAISRESITYLDDDSISISKL